MSTKQSLNNDLLDTNKKITRKYFSFLNSKNQLYKVNKEKGITLVALIITIIVLLILARGVIVCSSKR